MTAEVHDLAAARDSHAKRLREAGWESKERLGKTIWQCPSGWRCWYSEEMALDIETRQREGNGEE